MTVARNVTRPRIDAAGAAALAAAHYGITGDVVELPSERDRNFRIDTGADRFVLKVAHADTAASVLDLQARCLDRAAAAFPAGSVPRVVADHMGHSRTKVVVDGLTHHVRLVTHVPGRTLGSLRPKPMPLLRRVGELAGRMLDAFAGFGDPAVPEDFAWDLCRSPERVRTLAPAIPQPQRALLLTLTDRAASIVSPRDAGLPRQMIHGDLNDHNVIVEKALGIIDFGDVHRSYRVAEVAVAAAYAAFGYADPVEAVATVAAGADTVTPLDDVELAVIGSLVVLRLALSVAMAAEQMAADPENAYLAISQNDAWTTLEHLSDVPPRLVTARIRAACGRAPVAASAGVGAWLRRHAAELATPLGIPIEESTTCIIDWSVTSPDAAHPEVAPPMADQIAHAAELMRRCGASVGLGRYGEPRLVYAAPEFTTATNRGPGARTVHLGVDLSCPPGTAVCALWDATIARVEIEAVAGGYGPVLTLRHSPPDGPEFFTLYGHLDAGSIAGRQVGDVVGCGDPIAAVGAPPQNGDWPPHLHFQLIADHLDLDGPFPGVALPDQWEVWSSLSPSPAVALRLPHKLVDAPHPDDGATVRRRAAVLPQSMSTSYAEPLVAVRGHGAYLYDGWGRAHLDCVNNVAHVGHEHPAVVAALTAQARLLNTNSRYPHPERVRYLERLLARFPDGFDTAFLVGSGSEANDLALRIARTITGRRDLVVVEGAYHGHTGDLIEASPYKHDGPGGTGTPPDVHVVPLPDPYRSPERARPPGIEVALAGAAANGGAAAFIAESIFGVAGQIIPPPGWLAASYAQAHATGALTIADEVQVGMGRVGTHWWAFERDGAMPDIVTLGKPLGNGHPLAAVVTRRDIADAFANGMEYFNTFGGNPVSCAVGNAVLDVIDEEGLLDHAQQVGAYLLAGLGELARRHELIGDVRGVGMFTGIEVVTDREQKVPATDQARYLVERARHQSVLLSVDGLYQNVIKIKPPLAFGRAEADRLCELLDSLLGEDAAQPQPVTSTGP